MGCCCLPPDRVKLTVNSKKETNSRVKMGKESRWASVIYPLKESKWDKGHYELLLFTPWQSQTNSEQQGQNGQRVKMGQESRWASVIYPLKESKWGFCCLPPDRIKLAVNSKKETNNRVKMGQRSRWASVIYPLNKSKWWKGHYGLLVEWNWQWTARKKQTAGSKWAKGQDGLLLFTPWKSQNGGCCCLPPDRVKLIVNSKKETNSRVKMGEGSRWASVIYPWIRVKMGLLLFTPWQSQTNSEQQERNKQQGQIGQRVKMGQGPRCTSVLYPLTESN